ARLQGDIGEGELAALQALEDAAEAHETRVELGTDADLRTEAFDHARLRQPGLLLERTHPQLARADLDLRRHPRDGGIGCPRARDLIPQPAGDEREALVGVVRLGATFGEPVDLRPEELARVHRQPDDLRQGPPQQRERSRGPQHDAQRVAAIGVIEDERRRAEPAERGYRQDAQPVAIDQAVAIAEAQHQLERPVGQHALAALGDQAGAVPEMIDETRQARGATELTRRHDVVHPGSSSKRSARAPAGQRAARTMATVSVVTGASRSPATNGWRRHPQPSYTRTC